jgi:hypothetical protein
MPYTKGNVDNTFTQRFVSSFAFYFTLFIVIFHSAF